MQLTISDAVGCCLAVATPMTLNLTLNMKEANLAVESLTSRGRTERVMRS